MGDGMVQWKKYSQALTLFNQALSVAQRNSDMQDPLLVYSGKVDALIGLDRIDDARSLLDTALRVAQAKGAVGYQAELRLKYASVDIGKGDRRDALHQLEQALLLARQAQGSRIEAEATFMLAQVQLAEGQFKSASASITHSIEKSWLATRTARQAFALRDRGDRHLWRPDLKHQEHRIPPEHLL